MDPGSDVANLSVMGYDPNKYYTGRSPIEAASIGVPLSDTDVAFRCNRVTLDKNEENLIMNDYSAGHIATDDALIIINALKENLDTDEIKFYPGVSYRHLMVWENGKEAMTTTPPHDISDKEIASHLPTGEGSLKILELMEKSQKILPGLEINKLKIAGGEKPVSSIWLWGQGKKLEIPSFSLKYGISGSVISAVDLIKGLGLSAGLKSIDVPGATGYLDTNYQGKVDAALKELEKGDFVYLHVEAPDEASHKGRFDEKIKAIEDFDSKIVAKVIKGLEEKFDEYSVMVMPDHPTPLSIKTHASDPVPYIIYSSKDKEKAGNDSIGYNESDAAASGVFIEKGWELMDRFINNK
jgi:2,3-bisphosphoglycerate-independent phosphoglycerate mutase